MPPMSEIKKRTIQRKKLSDIVFEQLITLIQEEGLEPGDQLPGERELMDTFGVGRPVVREAMQRLASKGMISSNSVRTCATSTGLYIGTGALSCASTVVGWRPTQCASAACNWSMATGLVSTSSMPASRQR